MSPDYKERKTQKTNTSARASKTKRCPHKILFVWMNGGGWRTPASGVVVFPKSARHEFFDRTSYHFTVDHYIYKRMVSHNISFIYDEWYFLNVFLFFLQGPKVQQKTKEQKLAAALAGGKSKKKVCVLLDSKCLFDKL
jgi:hypothetical protein